MSGSQQLPLEEWQIEDWRSFINHLPEIVPLVDIVCLLTPDQEFISINEEAADGYGMDPEDFAGQKCYKIIHDQDDPIDDCPCVETLDTGASAVGEVFEEDGRYYLPATAPIYDKSGEIQAVAHSICDVTDKQETLRALERHQDLLDYTQQLASVGGWEFDLETETLRWTDGTRYIHEVSDDFEPTLEDGLDFYHPDDRDPIEQAIEACLEQGRPYDLEARIVTAEENIRWVRTYGERVEKNGRTLLRGAIKDVTDRRKREQQLSVLNRILRHNLRNGMNVVKGQASLLAEAVDDDELQASATAIEDRAADLNRIGEKAATIESILQYDPEKAPTCDVEPMLTDLAAEFDAEYPHATITVTYPDTTRVQADERLEEAVSEAIDNAIRHNDRSNPEVRITVSPTDADESSEWIEIEIADNGPGIPEHERKTIKQGKETPLLHGTGLGLWLIYWIVTEFGGEVDISESGSYGSIVTLRLPAAPASRSFSTPQHNVNQ